MPCCKTTTTKTMNLTGWIGYNTVVYHSCARTERAALERRVLQTVPLPRETAQPMLDFALQVLRELPHSILPRDLGVCDYTEYPLQRTGAARERYQRAAEELLTRPFNKRDLELGCFVKAENAIPHKKANVVPRVISTRKETGALLLWSVIRPIETVFYTTPAHPTTLPNAAGIFGKGLTTKGRANLIISNLEPFANFRVLSCDCTKFDRHINEMLQNYKFDVYSMMTCPKGRGVLKTIRHGYMHSTMRTSCGQVIKNLPVALRSGDMDTALGNNLVAFSLHVLYRRFLAGTLPEAIQREQEAKFGVFRIQAHDYACLIDGDDVLAIVEADTQAIVERTLYPFMLQFGVDMRIDGAADTLEEIEWCQQKVITVRGEPKCVRDPNKVISTAHSSTKFSSEAYSRRRFATLGECELALNIGVPVLDAYARALLRAGSGPRVFENTGSEYRARVELRDGPIDTVRVPIDEYARETFARAFGISPDEQVRLEHLWDAWDWDPSITPCVFDQEDWNWLVPPVGSQY